jgi:flagellum-specific peptidoglycan hydrolase FlgJ
VISAPSKPAAAPSAAPTSSKSGDEGLEKKPEGTGSGGKFSKEGDFVSGLKPWAEYVSKAIGGNVPPFAILGQWAGESGTGKSLPADYNYAGIKAGKKFEKGDFVLTEERYTDKQLESAKKSGEDLERVLGQDDKMKKSGNRSVTVDEWYGKGTWQKTKDEGKNWVQVRSYFAKFKDLKDFADSFAGFIMSPRYAKAREQTTASGFGFEIAKAGYATASAEKYSAKVAAFDSKYSGAQVNSASTQVASDQRQQQKPTTPVVIDASTTNNTQVTKNESGGNKNKPDTNKKHLDRVT